MPLPLSCSGEEGWPGGDFGAGGQVHRRTWEGRRAGITRLMRMCDGRLSPHFQLSLLVIITNAVNVLQRPVVPASCLSIQCTVKEILSSASRLPCRTRL
jgi:hypothetical protein